MRITRIEIENFRSIEAKAQIFVSAAFTSFVGPNNVGKSNVLRALNLFFNRETEPGIGFNPAVDICKSHKKSPANISLLLALDPAKDKKLIAHLDAKLPGEFRNASLNISLRCYPSGTLQYTYTNAKGQRKSSPDVVMPIVQMIQAYIDCSYIPAIKDYKTIINSAMMRKIVAATFQGWGKGIQVSTALGKHKQQFQKVLEQLQKILDGSGEDVSSIVNSVVPKIKRLDFSLPYNDLGEFLGKLNLEITEDGLSEKVGLDGEGSGIQSFTIFSMLRLLYLLRPKNTYKKTQFIWLIEEPETFMHHDLQRKTYSKLRDYAKEGQIFITTHSPVFLDKRNASHALHVTKDKSTTEIKTINTQKLMEVVGGSLGVSLQDFTHFNRFNILVEGDSDVRILKGLNELFAAAGDDKVLDGAACNFVSCNGATPIPHFFSLYSVFNRYASFLAVFDRDPAGLAAYQILVQKAPKEDLFLVPVVPHQAAPAIEDIVEIGVWRKCLKKLDDEGLVQLISQKGKITGYQFDPKKRIDVKKRFADLLLKSAKGNLNPFEKYREFLRDVRKRCDALAAVEP